MTPGKIEPILNDPYFVSAFMKWSSLFFAHTRTPGASAKYLADELFESPFILSILPLLSQNCTLCNKAHMLFYSSQALLSVDEEGEKKCHACKIVEE